MNFEELIKKLHVLLAEKDVAEVKEEVIRVMKSYKSNKDDWKKYAHFSAQSYTRNLVDRGNGKFNLILLCWGEGQGSGVHDHSGSHCFMKIMEGQLVETLFAWPHDPNVQEQLTEIDSKTYENDQVAHICDDHGIHRVENRSHSNPAVSLHLYSPPFDAAQSFDENSGKAKKCKVTFHSENGQINN
ncbi:cysteine dioxygenase type 1 [Paramuricea clavata]|uniref:Cysteine dioxygenase n=1 Tax=Paramuricea clavata TaxID=317549 RepID=A0A6S7G456_PARCT|nr:cysteine dioxygenase type 1 [Paramuricea clavata]